MRRTRRGRGWSRLSPAGSTTWPATPGSSCSTPPIPRRSRWCSRSSPTSCAPRARRRARRLRRARRSRLPVTHAQVEPQPDGVALFRLDETRQPIRVAPGGFTVGERTVGADDLLREVAAQPGRFSPNVLLRPIVQDALFSYGRLRLRSERAGLPGAASRRLRAVRRTDAHHLSAGERDHRRPCDREVPGALRPRLRRPAGARRRRSEPPARGADPGRAGDGARGGGRRDGRAAGRRLDGRPAARPPLSRGSCNRRGAACSAISRRSGTRWSRPRSDGTRRSAGSSGAPARRRFPNGEPQERSVGTVYFLNRYGPAFVDRLLADLPLDPGHHWLLTV